MSNTAGLGRRDMLDGIHSRRLPLERHQAMRPRLPEFGFSVTQGNARAPIADELCRQGG